MLFKLSLKNIKKSFRDYVVYFFTLIIGVSIFYVFNAIDSQTVMMDVTASTKEIIKMMTNMLSGLSVFVSFVLGFLIIYANRFLMKRRNKEFGLYLMLGMGKRKISMILFFETLLVGILSMLAGLLLGVGLSQLMSIFVADMFEADMSRFQFVFSLSACKKTVLYFAVMYMVVMIFNTFTISKCKLIDLLQYSRRTEEVKMKNPWVCTMVFLAAVAALSYAYRMVSGGTERFNNVNEIFIPIVLGAVSTFFIFWSLSGLLLKLVMVCKNVYYKRLNSFTLRQLSSQINTMVMSVTIICLMLFVTICVLSSALSIKNSMNANLDKLAPADIQLQKGINMDDTWLEKGYNEIQIKNSNLNIAELYQQIGNDILPLFEEYVMFNTYRVPEITMGTTLGSVAEEVKRTYTMLDYDSLEEIIKISDYNKLAVLYGKETYTLESDEYMMIADFDSMIKVRNLGLETGQKITINGRVLKPKYAECQDGIIVMSGNYTNTGVIIVPDDAIGENFAVYNYLVGNYNAINKQEKIEIEQIILNLNTASEEYVFPSNNTRLDITEASTGIGALVTFIGLYLGIVFLIASAAILALKQLSESADNRERYGMLRKLGTDEKMIHKALFRQIGSFFLFPLVLALIHSVFGLKFSSAILETFGNEQLWISFVMTMGMLTVIYGGYFMITYYSSKNMIRER